MVGPETTDPNFTPPAGFGRSPSSPAHPRAGTDDVGSEELSFGAPESTNHGQQAEVEDENESSVTPAKAKHRKLEKFESLVLDDAKKEKIFEELMMIIRGRAGYVRNTLKEIMSMLVDESINNHHLSHEEFLELLRRGSTEDFQNESILVRELLVCFFRGLRQKRDIAQRQSQPVLPLIERQEEGVSEVDIENLKREFDEFVAELGTEKEEKKVYRFIEEQQKRYPNIDVIKVIEEDAILINHLTKKIIEETVDISAAKFKEAFSKNRTVLDFLFSRVLGVQGEKILTLEGPRMQLIGYLEKIGYRLENLDKLLSSQPVFKEREARQKVRRQKRMQVQEATGEPVFGITNGNSFHTWFARHFINDIRDQRVPKYRADLAGTSSVTMATMARIIVPTAEMREPLHMLVEESKNPQKFLWRLELDDVPVDVALEMIKGEITEGKNAIDKITSEALHFVPDETPEKKMAIFIPAICDERNIKNLLTWCDDPSLFLEDNPDISAWIVDTYQLREYASNDEDLRKATERIVGHQARKMLEFWLKSHDVLPGGNTKLLEERTKAFDARFRERFGIVADEIKPVRLRWRILQEVDGDGEPVLRDFMKAKVPQYKYEAVPDDEIDSGEMRPVKAVDGLFYKVKKIEEATLYEVTLHPKGEDPLTLYFFSPDFEKTGALWNSKSFQSRLVSQLRQGESTITDGTRICMAVKGKSQKDMRRAKDFVLNGMGGITVKVEVPSSGRLKEKDRPSVTGVLSAHHRAAQRGSKHHIRTKDGKEFTETAETQLYSVENLCIAWLSEETVMAHSIYDADRSLGLFREVLFPGMIYPAMRDFNNNIPKYKPQQ